MSASLAFPAPTLKNAMLSTVAEVYAKAMELTASANGGGGRNWQVTPGTAEALSSIEQIASKTVATSKVWDDLWPQWGDEKDDEMRHLRAMSFAAWRAIITVVKKEILFEVLASTSAFARFRQAKELLYL